ncbi:MAG: sugar transferase [bacterium]|nr:sugar transferase [bacterium]
MKNLIKRVMDILIALPVLVIFSPVMVVITVVILLDSGFPVFFRQQRPGLNEEPFVLVKFRTMKNTCDEKGELLPDGQRLTGVGKWLRKLSLDELPQFLNVLKGEMSVVGPRPLLMEYLPLYNERQKMRHWVRPGITGWAQVNGRNAVNWQERFQLDVWYVENRSLALDFKILVMTFFKVLKREGISSEGNATVERFKGNKES